MTELDADNSVKTDAEGRFADARRGTNFFATFVAATDGFLAALDGDLRGEDAISATGAGECPTTASPPPSRKPL